MIIPKGTSLELTFSLIAIAYNRLFTFLSLKMHLIHHNHPFLLLLLEDAPCHKVAVQIVFNFSATLSPIVPCSSDRDDHFLIYHDLFLLFLNKLSKSWYKYNSQKSCYCYCQTAHCTFDWSHLNCSCRSDRMRCCSKCQAFCQWIFILNIWNTVSAITFPRIPVIMITATVIVTIPPNSSDIPPDRCCDRFRKHRYILLVVKSK